MVLLACAFLKMSNVRVTDIAPTKVNPTCLYGFIQTFATNCTLLEITILNVKRFIETAIVECSFSVHYGFETRIKSIFLLPLFSLLVVFLCAHVSERSIFNLWYRVVST